jgi:hypothetical protein
VADRALVLGKLENEAVAVLRQRADDAPIEAGVVRGVKDGEPIVGELVSLKPTEEGSRVCDVEVHVDNRPTAKGPARVASNAYRSGWDALFGDKAN